ncbi:MAG: NAD(P)-dependent oxidoreductase [Prevotella sp.]|nr:NAD(P)-dependent oxidoreductase [Prevotella sp.]
MNNQLLQEQQSYLAERLRGKTIMVSGATGLVGSAIVRYLMALNDGQNADIKIVPLYRDREKYDRVYDKMSGRTDLEPQLFTADADIAFDLQADYIIHCAGISGGSKMHLKDPVKIFDTGIGGTKQLLDYASTHNCEGFVYVSTYEIYGGVNEEQLVAENHPCLLDPMVLRNSYAEVKRVCESMLTAYSAKYGFKVYSGRLTSTFGTGVAYNDPRFFAEFARCVVEGRNIVMKSTGGTVRNYLDVDDAASAFLYILVNGENCNAYNLTNRDNAISVRDIAKKLIALGGDKVELVFDIAEDIKALGFRKEGITVMDPSKLENLGWKPVYTFEDTLEKLLSTLRG